jgi:truncated hemoglobin YjbI
MSKKIFDLIGGRETLEKVHKVFYDKVYEHSWLKKFFSHIEQTHIENQQTDFMTKALGGPAIYCGRLPVPAHKHMFISEELFDLRHQLLKESLEECRIDPSVIVSWLKIDLAFKSALTKSNPSECEKRFFTDELVIILNPEKKAS